MDISQLHKTNLKLENKLYLSYISRECEFLDVEIKATPKEAATKAGQVVTIIKIALRKVAS